MLRNARHVPAARVDERDTMFARAARRPGTPAYEDYYSRHPDLRALDDRLRALPALCEPGGLHHHPAICGEAERHFARIPAFEPDPQLVASEARRLAQAGAPAEVIAALARRLGAVAVGFTRVEQAFVYAFRGRHDANYGEPIVHELPHALVFLVEMDHAAMQRSPRAEVIRESARQYYRGAVISRTLAAVLERCGHRARSHHDAHYDVILPPLAVQAGLGELGRNNILVADRYGSRVRIGAVTTDLALPAGAPVDLGVADFCEICRKCADNCPSRALSLGGRESVRGVSKWPTDVERCYGYWRRVGTDCGICMACCPFSHKSNALHGVVRRLVRRSRRAARIALWCDDLVYGRKWNRRRLRWL
jgi:epoxyqueuosine reductase QueG